MCILNITIETKHTDVNNNTRSFQQQLSTSVTTNDYTMLAPYAFQNDGNDSMYATLSETNPELGYSHYFYNVVLEGQPIISSISLTLQKVQLALTNTALNAGVQSTQTVSTAKPAKFKTNTKVQRHNMQSQYKPNTPGALRAPGGCVLYPFCIMLYFGMSDFCIGFVFYPFCSRGAPVWATNIIRHVGRNTLW